MALSKTIPPDVAEKMHKAIARLDANGELKKLLIKWQGSNPL